MAKDTTRVQLELPARSMSRLVALKDKTEATSYAEVLKNALRLYEHVVSEYERGSSIQIRSKDGEVKEYAIFVNT